MLQRKSSAANIIDLIITFWYSFQTKLSILTQKVQISCILLRDRSVPASRVTIVHQTARRYYFLFIPFKEVKKLFFLAKEQSYIRKSRSFGNYREWLVKLGQPSIFGQSTICIWRVVSRNQFPYFYLIQHSYKQKFTMLGVPGNWSFLAIFLEKI